MIKAQKKRRDTCVLRHNCEDVFFVIMIWLFFIFLLFIWKTHLNDATFHFRPFIFQRLIDNENNKHLQAKANL